MARIFEESYIHELKEFAQKCWHYSENDKAYLCEEIVEELEQMPELVRCKDCKHCVYISVLFGDVRCTKLFTDYMNEDSYCSYGERKDHAKE